MVGVGDIYVGVGVCGRGGGYICRCRRGVVGMGDIYVGVGCVVGVGDIYVGVGGVW